MLMAYRPACPKSLLSLLVMQKRLAKAAPIPCVARVAAPEGLAGDDSMAENMQRAALHPLDQCRVFAALREKGQGKEAIAAAFFVTLLMATQRLKLASVVPALLAQLIIGKLQA